MIKHFFAVLAAAFFFSIATVAAQKGEKKLSQAQFEQMVINDAPKAYSLAQQNKLTFDQLQFFIQYEGQNERNLHYLDTLQVVYWRQLTHKDKLNYQHIQFIEDYFGSYSPEGQTYSFSRTFAYVIEHQSEFKKAWGDSLYNQYMVKNLDIGCHEIELYFAHDKFPPIEEREEKVEKYLALIKKNLPAYEPRVRADVCWRCVYEFDKEPEKYYYWLNKYLMEYETDPDHLNSDAAEATRLTDKLEYKQMGLNWINKAIAIQPKLEYYICKAELEYQLGQIDAARQSIKLSERNAPDNENWVSEYRRRVAALIANGK